MKKYMDIYKKAKENTKTMQDQLEMAYLREALEKEIDGNKDTYMSILCRCKEACDLSSTSLFFAMATLLVTVLWNLACDDLNTNSALSIMVILIFAYILWILKTKDVEKYRKMLIILEELDIEGLKGE